MMSTLFLLFFIFTISVVTTSELKSPEEVKEILLQCSKDAGLNRNITSLDSIDFDHAKKEEKCFVKCLAEKYDVLGKDGHYDVKAMKEYIDGLLILKENPKQREKYYKAVNECTSKFEANFDDLCERVYEEMSCIALKVE